MRKKNSTGKRYTAAQKAEIVLELLQDEKNIAQIASKYEVHPSQIYRWKNLAIERFALLFEDEAGQKQQAQEYEHEIQQLYAEIGRLTLKLEWLKKKSGLRPPQEGKGPHD
jgi:putative transposase